MKTLFALFALLVSISFCPADEYQISFDTNKTIMEIDSSLESRLDLFPEYNNFKSARLFSNADSLFFLEIVYGFEEKLLRTKKILTLEQLDSLRSQISIIANDTSEAGEPKVNVLYNSSGRTELLTYSTIFSFAAYGPLVSHILSSESTNLAAGSYFIVGAAGYFLPYYLTKGKSIPLSASRLYAHTTLMGFAQTTLLYSTFSDESDNFSRDRAFAMLLGSLAQGIAGYQWGKLTDMPLGEAEMLTTYGYFGFGYGLALPALFEAEERTTYYLSMGLMPYAGLLIGSQLVKLQDISHGDSKIFSTLGILGSYYPIAIGLLTEKKDPTYYAGSFMLGATAGFVAAHYLVKGYDFSSSAGFNIGLAAFAGGLLGAGIGRLMSEGYRSTLTGSILGSALGFSIGYASETIDAKKEHTSDTGFNFNFNPYSLTNMFIDKSKRDIPFYNHPILNISYSF